MSSSAGSRSSGLTGSSGSIGSSANGQPLMDALQDGDDEAQDVGDLLQQDRNVQQAVHATLYTLTKQRAGSSVRWAAVIVVITFLQMFRVIFNTANGWNIDRELWIFQATYWLLYRTVVFRQEYSTYVAVLYVLSGLVLLCLGITGWVAVVVLRKDDSTSGWLQRLVAALQWLACILFQWFWVANLDYLVFMFDCKWTEVRTTGAVHNWYTEQNCLAMPHLVHMLFAGVMILVLAAATVGMSMGDCDLNLMSRDYLSSAAASLHFKTLALRMLIVVMGALQGLGNLQAVVILICTALTTLLLISQCPFYVAAVNCVWGGLWMGLSYTATLLVVLVYTRGAQPDAAAYARSLTWDVLYGIFPAVALGAALTWTMIQWKRRPLPALRAAFAARTWDADLRGVHNFASKEQVWFLAAVMRKWDLDGVPDPEATSLGKFIIECGLARFPNDPSMLVTAASLLVELQEDEQTARVQLQAAAKCSPTYVDRYFIHVATQLLKKCKSASDDLNLLSYVEFQRNYLACVRMHKVALAAQRRFWSTLLHEAVQYKDVQKALDLMDKAEKSASQVYKKVMELYPRNGKLLKVYGRFLEFVRNDPWTANRYYLEARKQGTQESLLELTRGQCSSVLRLMGEVDEKADAIIIINSSGLIMMVNKAAAAMFGYPKEELEGKNVSCLMPQPFSGRHNGYLQRYASTGEARILDSKRHVVALHKNRTLFPIDLVVTKLSGTGQDGVFLGVLRLAADQDTQMVRVWTTPQGTILCCDQRYKDAFGVAGEALLGKSCHSLGKDPEALTLLLQQAQEVIQARGDLRQCKLRTRLMHAFLPPVDVEVSVELGGTEDNPILVLCLHCTAVNSTNLLVTTQKGSIVYVTSSLAKMLGHSVATLTGMQLRSLMPPPFSDLHTPSRWLKAVDLVARNGSKVPVTLKCSTHTDGDHVKLVIQVARSSEEARLDQKRLLLSLDSAGTIVSVDSPLAPASLFGFHPEELQGRNLTSCVQQAQDWVLLQHGSDTDLLALLMEAVACEPGPEAQSCWRVGVRAPANALGTAVAAVAAERATRNSDELLAGLAGRSRQRAAVMRVRSLVQPEDDPVQLALQGRPMLQVELWRADLLSSVVELDRSMHISKADDALCLITGCCASECVGGSLKRLLGLPSSFDLSSQHDGTCAKKGLMKSGSAEAQVGSPQRYMGHHRDGQPLQLSGQLVASKQRRHHKLLRLNVVAPSSGDVRALLALRDAQRCQATPARQQQQQQQHQHQHQHQQPLKDLIRLDSATARRPSQLPEGEEEEQSSEGQEGTSRAGSGPAGSAEALEPHGATRRAQHAAGGDFEAVPGRAGSPELHDHLQSRLRVQKWVHDSFRKCADRPDGEEEVEEDLDAVARSIPGQPGPGNAEPAAVAGDCAEPRPAASVGSASQASGDDALSVVSGSAAGNDGDELTADFRRAKRLKKLTRLLTGSAAQSSTLRLNKHTWVVVTVLLAAHVACFLALTLEINKRYESAYRVGVLAKTTDRFLRIGLRNNILQKCSIPEYAGFVVCSDSALKRYMGLFAAEIDVARTNHQGLLLGFQTLDTFKDPRLLAFWLHHGLTESRFLPSTQNATNVVVTTEASRTLWDMGNRVLNYASDVHFGWPSLQASINSTEAWNYVQLNTQGGMFNGYAWSLDSFVDYTWGQLTKIGTVLIVLLVVEVVLVQTLCIGYQFVILKTSQRQHMQRFSSFLMLPTTTLRIMATRQLQVDEDDKSEVDDEDLEAAAAAATGAEGDCRTPKGVQDGEEEQGPAAKKSVRMAEGGAAEDDAEDDEGRAPKGRGRGKAKGARGPRGKGAAASKRLGSGAGAAAPRSKRSGLWKAAFGWLSCRLKVHGKKLFSDSTPLYRFMVPLLLWLAAVAAVFGVSLDLLSNLQAPIASLDAAAHVLYRTARVRAFANMYALADVPSDVDKYRSLLQQETDVLASEYDVLMAGGRMMTMAPVSFDPTVPPAAYASKAFARLFFETTDCLRTDRSTCLGPDSPYYGITHEGLDAMQTRFIQEMRAFAAAPDSEAWPNNTAYLYIYNVVANDLTGGLDTAITMFGDFTISHLEDVKRLHIVLLVATLLLLLAYVALVFRPYAEKLSAESKVFAGLLSNLPAEVDAEAQARLAVLGSSKDGAAAGAGLTAGAPPAASGGMVPSSPWPIMGMMPGAAPAGAPTTMMQYGSSMVAGAGVPAGIRMPGPAGRYSRRAGGY